MRGQSRQGSYYTGRGGNFYGGGSFNSNYQGQKNYYRNQPPQQQLAAAPQITQEQAQAHKERTKELEDEFFLRALRLVVLPGGFPVCFAVGRSLVTDIDVWKSFKESCKRRASKAADEEIFDAAQPPFSWGTRPIDPRDLHSIFDQETQDWLWCWVLLNIARYPAAAAKFSEAIRGSKDKEAKEVLDALNAMEYLTPEASNWLVNQLQANLSITPGQLSAEFTQHPDQLQLVNLALLQTDPQAAQAKANKAGQEAAKYTQVAQSDADLYEDNPEPPQAQPTYQQQRPPTQGNFIRRGF